MRRTVLAPTLALAALISVMACSEIEGPQPLKIILTAEQETAAVGDSIRFRVEAGGFEMIRIEVDMGDGSDDVEFDLPALDTAFATWRHAYNEAGTFQVKATVLDWSGGTKADSMLITVE